MTAVCGAGSSGMSHLRGRLKEKEDRLCDEHRSRDTLDLTAGHGAPPQPRLPGCPGRGRQPVGGNPAALCSLRGRAACLSYIPRHLLRRDSSYCSKSDKFFVTSEGKSIAFFLSQPGTFLGCLIVSLGVGIM